jgi:hypothetical protein
VAQFNRDAAKSQQLVVNDKDAWENGRYIARQSWAIMPGEKAENGVADACAKQLSKKA